MSVETFAPLVEAVQGQFDEYQTYEQLREYDRQLVEEFPELARLETLGYAADRSTEYTEGRPIEALFIGERRNPDNPYALIQIEHENELSGARAIQLLARLACEQPEILDDLGYNLILFNRPHPDAQALQRWIGQEFTLNNYTLNAHRSAGPEQVAWAYDYQYGGYQFMGKTPESRASMRLMQRHRPEALCALHNCFDAAYAHLSERNAALLDQLEAVMARYGLPLQRGEPEVPYVRLIHPDRPGFYTPVLTARIMIDNEGSHGEGDSSTGYLAGLLRREPSAMLNECSYFQSAAASRHNEFSDLTRREVFVTLSENDKRIYNVQMPTSYQRLQRLVGGSEQPEVHRLARSIEWVMDYHYDQRVAFWQAKEDSALDQLATVPQTYSIESWRAISALFFGQIHTLAHFLGETGVAQDVRGQVLEHTTAITEASPLQVIPLHKNVGAQALSCLVALQYSTKQAA